MTLDEIMKDTGAVLALDKKHSKIKLCVKNGDDWEVVGFVSSVEVNMSTARDMPAVYVGMANQGQLVRDLQESKVCKNQRELMRLAGIHVMC